MIGIEFIIALIFIYCVTKFIIMLIKENKLVWTKSKEYKEQDENNEKRLEWH